jgi:hypothetical protein
MGMTIHEFRKGFKKFFPELDAGKYIDKSLLSEPPHVFIDLMAFDDWLHRKFGDYEQKRRCSMSDILEKEFSKEAMLFVKEAI